MSTVLYILVAVLVFGVLIAVHELGHFMAAKACGVRVNEFSVGMGPAIFKRQKGETLYALRCLPFGGFCAMEGEDEASEDPRALENKGFWAKLLIFAAGAVMNFLTGLLILLCLNSGVKAVVQPVIGSFADGCPLQETLQVGDRIAAIDGEKIYVYSDVSLLLNLNQTGQYDLTLVRDGKKVELKGVSMERREYTDQNGNAYTGYGLNFTVKETTLADRLQMSLANAADFVRMVRLSLQMLVTGQAGVKDISGPVGIVTVITDVGQSSGSTAAAVDMESCAIATNGYRYRIPYGTLLSVSDLPLHAVPKLPAQAQAFYENSKQAHMMCAVDAMEKLAQDPDKLHTRKLRRTMGEVPFR